MTSSETESAPLWRLATVRRLALDLLIGTGMASDKADAVVDILMDGDLMDHTTHGLRLLPRYLAEIRSGRMSKDGAPTVIAQRPAALTWDGHYLPGPWLTLQAIDHAIDMASTYGTGTVVMRRSHHIAGLVTYLNRAVERGFAIEIMSASPHNRTVSAHGGIEGVMSPNPLAFGYPTDDGPVLIDVSMSTTANNTTIQYHSEGRKLPHAWVKDAAGNPTDDPAVLFTDTPGTLMPMGGPDHGHKGFGMGLMVEAMTCGLSGHGRADGVEQWGASVFVQILDPDAFGGRDALVRETGFLARACRASAVRPGDPPVRLPGQRAVAKRTERLKTGFPLATATVDALMKEAETACPDTPRPEAH
ncbi:Ldh family oxidoreductase [Fodinicurvata sp. EGI_FJ10296]|uniref:Ldh family oxidoreductase n=1 Tax=Fodinicurvata sp. EGI_FJ10296 TaxID=3231908 RepID=UPI003454680C